MTNSNLNTLYIINGSVINKMTPQQMINCWNKNSEAVKKGFSKPQQINDFNDNFKFYLLELLVANHINI